MINFGWKALNIILRLGICQKIHATQFSGEKFLHTENA